MCQSLRGISCNQTFFQTCQTFVEYEDTFDLPCHGFSSDKAFRGVVRPAHVVSLQCDLFLRSLTEQEMLVDGRQDSDKSPTNEFCCSLRSLAFFCSSRAMQDYHSVKGDIRLFKQFVLFARYRGRRGPGAERAACWHSSLYKWCLHGKVSRLLSSGRRTDQQLLGE